MSAPPPPPYNPGGGNPPPYQPAPQPPGPYPPPAPPPKRSSALPWILGGGAVALLALCICGVLFFVGALGGGVFALFRATAAPRDATTAYYEAVAAQDYATAHTYLSATQRAAITPRALETVWRTREGANGPVDRFDIANTNISTTNGVSTATVTGTLRYTGGASEAKTLTLAKEGDDWRISSVP